MRTQPVQISVAVALAAIVTPGLASAQTGIEEITVTARKRAETLQDVPLAVSAVGQERIEQAFLLDTTSLAQFAPNVVFDNIESGNPGGGGFSIRGISFQDIEKSFDPVVLVVLDGVAIGTNTANVMQLLDVERIEVLRGPQGTLFGKNAVAGLIQVHRTEPQLESSHGKVRVQAGSYETYNIEGLYNYGSENWALKLTGASLNQDKGYFRNITVGERMGDRDTLMGGAHLLVEPTDSLKAEIQFNYTDMDGIALPQLDLSHNNVPPPEGDIFCVFFGLCSAVDGEPYTGSREVSAGRIDPGTGQLLPKVEFEQKMAIAEVNWDFLDDYTMTYIGGWIDSDDRFDADYDDSPLRIFGVFRWSEYEQWSHELRVTRDAGDDLTWQLGLFYWDAESHAFQNTDTFALTGLPFPGEYQDTLAGSESWSVFGEGDWRLPGNLDSAVLTLGFRYIEEEKTMTRFVYLPNSDTYQIPPGSGGTRTDDDVIWRAGLRYEWNDALMTYFTWSTGFRSGGFSTRAQTVDVLARGFAPETVENYELGVRSELFDNRLTLNATLFHMIYTDMQLDVSIPAPPPANNQQAIENIGEATFDGVELDASFYATDSWRLSGNVGWLDAEYEEFTADIYGLGVITDNTDLPLRRAPEWTFSIESVLERNIGPGIASWRVGYNWRDDYSGTLWDHPGTHVDSFGLLDMAIAYEVDSWRFSLFGRNLTDEDEYSHTFVVAPTVEGGSFWKFAVPRPGTEWGIEAVYRFGDF
jgi:iron complex outermembrane receptor protein